MSAREAYDKNLTQWSDVQAHLPLLYESAKGNCVEIGVREGMSTSALLAGIEEHGGHLWSIDINDCQVFAGHPRWTFIHADSKHVKPPCREIDVLFVDGDHSYDGAFSDLQMFGPLAKRIFVHDTEAPNYPDVKRAVEDFVRVDKRAVFYHLKSFGMAEIQ